MTGKKIGSSAVSFNKRPKTSGSGALNLNKHPKTSGSSAVSSNENSSSSSGHATTLAKLDTAVRGATLAVGAVTAGTNLARLTKKPAPAPSRREFDDLELHVREPAKSKVAAPRVAAPRVAAPRKKNSGGKLSGIFSKIGHGLNGAQVAADAVSDATMVANAINQPATRGLEEKRLVARGMLSCI
jgi:hypothetical protein